MVKMFFEGFVEYSGANLSAEVSGLSAKGIEIGFKNFLVDPKNAVSPFVQKIQTSLDLKANSIAPSLLCLQHARLSAGF
jgi:hypothetical protein